MEAIKLYNYDEPEFGDGDGDNDEEAVFVTFDVDNLMEDFAEEDVEELADVILKKYDHLELEDIEINIDETGGYIMFSSDHAHWRDEFDLMRKRFADMVSYSIIDGYEESYDMHMIDVKLNQYDLAELNPEKYFSYRAKAITWEEWNELYNNN